MSTYCLLGELQTLASWLGLWVQAPRCRKGKESIQHKPEWARWERATCCLGLGVGPTQIPSVSQVESANNLGQEPLKLAYGYTTAPKWGTDKLSDLSCYK